MTARALPSGLLLVVAAPLLSGCLGTVADVVTAPVRIAGKAVDLATTSQSESDEKRGREARKYDERRGKLERRYRDLREDCEDGERDACREAERVRDEIEDLRESW